MKLFDCFPTHTQVRYFYIRGWIAKMKTNFKMPSVTELCLIEDCHLSVSKQKSWVVDSCLDWPAFHFPQGSLSCDVAYGFAWGLLEEWWDRTLPRQQQPPQCSRSRAERRQSGISHWSRRDVPTTSTTTFNLSKVDGIQSLPIRFDFRSATLYHGKKTWHICSTRWRVQGETL